MQGNRPTGRKKNVTGQASQNSMQTHGPGMGTGPQQQRPAGGSADNQQRPAQRPAFRTGAPAGNRQNSTRGLTSNPLVIIIVLAALLLGGGGGLSGLLGGGDGGTTLPSGNSGNSGSQGTASDANAWLSQLLGDSDATQAPLPTATRQPSATATRKAKATATRKASARATATPKPAALSGQPFSASADYSAVNRSVAAGSREKYTAIKGSGKDTMTIMVYMCGADLESRSAMGTRDLQEMLNASFGDNIRLIVYTGGSTKWQNNLVSAQVNQLWQVKDGGLVCLEKNLGTASMTSPSTLVSFIQYGAKNFPANRYALILWDHGSGSVTGYGYDEKNARAGSMSLAGLDSAFKQGGIKFDFIGFDACLMATVETALMASRYADYLIASEETEPGIGWYYTDWLTALGKDSSMATLDIGKNIIDGFVSACARQCRGQQTTLSITDLAELENTVPSRMTAFAQSISSMIANEQYKTVSAARYGCREFATSARVDQVDLSDLCQQIGTQEGKDLSLALRSAVKYNRIGNITNAYGLSIYFPYQKVSNVEKAVSAYEAIGMDSSYADAIRAFASVEASGQAVSYGGNTSAMSSLFGMGSSSSSASSADMIAELLSAFLGGGGSYYSDRGMTQDQMAGYLTNNFLDADQLVFRQEGESYVLSLPEDQWSLIQGADLNLFYDNGQGYVDLGLDNLFDYDEAGRMIADLDGDWVAINGQPVAYYHEETLDVSENEWRIAGRVPVLRNGERAELIVIWDQDHENGYVAGARSVYQHGETETVAKAITEIQTGDKLEFLADLYDYEQNYTDSYRLGSAVTVEGELTVSNVLLPDPTKALAAYRFTDIYNQPYWTPVIGQ